MKSIPIPIAALVLHASCWFSFHTVWARHAFSRWTWRQRSQTSSAPDADRGNSGPLVSDDVADFSATLQDKHAGVKRLRAISKVKDENAGAISVNGIGSGGGSPCGGLRHAVDECVISYAQITVVVAKENMATPAIGPTR